MSNSSTASSDSGEIAKIDRTGYGNAPRVTVDLIEELIASEHYFTAYEGAIAAGIEPDQKLPEALKLLTICVLEMKNGFTVLGQSACASPSNFSREIGQKVARQDAINKIWPLLGYQLRSKLKRIESVSDIELGEALTHLLAFQLGNTSTLKPAHAKSLLDKFEEQDQASDVA